MDLHQLTKTHLVIDYLDQAMILWFVNKYYNSSYSIIMSELTPYYFGLSPHSISAS